MTIQNFIERAIEGGWKHEEDAPSEVLYKWKVMMDVEAWQAVGKVENWNDRIVYEDERSRVLWQHNMISLMQALIDGQSIEQYLETL